MPKPLTVRITTNCGKFLINGTTRPLYLPPEKSVCRSKSKLEVDMEQQTDSKLEKEYVKAAYKSPYLFNLYAEYIMQNAWLDEA